MTRDKKTWLHVLAVPKSARSTLIAKLAGMPLVHQAIRTLRAQRVAETALGIVPIRRKLDSSGCEYRVRFLESLVIADEIFAREVYREAFAGREIRSVVDVGANVGYFTLYGAHRTGRHDLVALAVEADERAAAEVRWHVARNRLDRTKVVIGVAGLPKDVHAATFWFSASNVASSAQPSGNPNVPEKGERRRATIATVDVAAEWRRLAGERRIDLLKIDVEGFECELIRNSPELLGMTDRLVVEWHKWTTSGAEVDALLVARGFACRKIIDEDEHAGLAVYDRRLVDR